MCRSCCSAHHGDQHYRAFLLVRVTTSPGVSTDSFFTAGPLIFAWPVGLVSFVLFKKNLILSRITQIQLSGAREVTHCAAAVVEIGADREVQVCPGPAVHPCSCGKSVLTIGGAFDFFFSPENWKLEFSSLLFSDPRFKLTVIPDRPLSSGFVLQSSKSHCLN